MRRIILFLFAVFVVTAWTLPSFAAETTFSGTWRVRAHAFENQDDFSDNTDTLTTGGTSTYLDQRFRLGITSRASEDFGGFWELQTDTINDDGTIGGSNATWPANMGVSTNQAYLDFNVQNVNVKVGKMDYATPGDIHNLVLIETYSAITASTQVGPANIYASFLKIAETDKTTGGADDDRGVFVLGGQFSPSKGVSAGAFWAVDRDGKATDTSGARTFTGETTIHYVGANGSFAAGPVNLALEGVIRSGEQDVDAADGTCWNGGNRAACDYSGWVFAADANMSPNDMITIGLAVGIGSGDDNHEDNDLEAFSGINASHNATSIFFDGGDGAWSNGNQAIIGGATSGMIQGTSLVVADLGGITYIKPYVKVKVNDQIALTGKFAWIKFTDEEDSRLCNDIDGDSGLSSVSGSPCASGDKDDSAGTEVNLQADYTIHTASSLTLSLYANWFFPGDGILTTTQKTDGHDDTTSEYLAKLQYSF